MNKQIPFQGLADPLGRLVHLAIAVAALAAAPALAQPTVLLQGPAATVTADDVKTAAQAEVYGGTAGVARHLLAQGTGGEPEALPRDFDGLAVGEHGPDPRR